MILWYIPVTYPHHQHHIIVPTRACATVPSRQRRGLQHAALQLKQTRDVGQLLQKCCQIFHIHIKQMASQIWNLIPKEAYIGNYAEIEVCLLREFLHWMLHWLRDFPACVTFIFYMHSPAIVRLVQNYPHQSLRLMRLKYISFRMRKAESAPLGFQAANSESCKHLNLRTCFWTAYSVINTCLNAHYSVP